MTVINSFNFRYEIVLCFFLLVYVVQVQKKKKKYGHKDTTYKISTFQQHQVIKILKISQVKKYLILG